MEPCRKAGGLQADREDERQEGWEADVSEGQLVLGRPSCHRRQRCGRGCSLKNFLVGDTALGPGEERAGSRRQWMGERKSKEHSLCPASDTHCPCSLLVTSGHSLFHEGREGTSVVGSSTQRLVHHCIVTASQMLAEEGGNSEETDAQLCVCFQDRRDRGWWGGELPGCLME